MRDINEEKRDQLFREIIQVEYQEEDLLSAKKRYERNLEDFHADIQWLNHQINQRLEESPGSRLTIEQFEEENWSIQRSIGWYIEEELDDLDKQSRKARRLLEDKRDRLITERNRLPWE